MIKCQTVSSVVNSNHSRRYFESKELSSVAALIQFIYVIIIGIKYIEVRNRACEDLIFKEMQTTVLSEAVIINLLAAGDCLHVPTGAELKEKSTLADLHRGNHLSSFCSSLFRCYTFTRYLK